MESPGIYSLKHNLVKLLATKFTTNEKDIVPKMKKGTVLKFI